MQFRSQQYYQASLERMEQSRVIYKLGSSFALSMYCAGLAVECLLRAYRWQADATFEGRHDLEQLLKVSRLLTIDDDYLRRKGASDEEIRASGLELRGAMNEIVVLWHNNLRFASEESLKSLLKSIGRMRGAKGDPLKKSARDLLEAAQSVINRGIILWTSRIK